MQENQNLQIISQIEKIEVALNEIKNQQKILSAMLQKNNAVTMKKLMKLQEYNQIDDMCNHVFEERLSAIEDCLCTVVGKISYR